MIRYENGQANSQAGNGGRAGATQAADSLVAEQMKNLALAFRAQAEILKRKKKKKKKKK